MERWAQQISRHILQSADVLDEAAQRHDPVYLQSLERLTIAWAEQRKARLWHRSDKTGKVVEYLFSPYFIEPYAVGQTTMLIGLSEPPGSLRTLKIERIERVEQTHESYAIPLDFDPRELLADAWGIWYTDHEPIEVVLKFHPRVANRVRETRWHRSEEETELADGSLLWKAKVAEAHEMIPWIRGWGADVEVLGPEELRKSITNEARKLAQLYLSTEVKDEINNRFIAHLRLKDREPQYLTDHLREVSELTGHFAENVGLNYIGQILGLLHDLGKASKEFQNYIRSASGLLNPDEDEYVDVSAKKGKVDHSSAGAQVIYKHLGDKGPEGFLAAQFLSLCIASHHSGLIDCLTPNGENNFTKRIEKSDEKTHANEAISNLEKDDFEKVFTLLSMDIGKQLLDKLNCLRETKDSKETLVFKYGLLVRFLFSCLIDADRLNTADFENPNNTHARNYDLYHPWEILI